MEFSREFREGWQFYAIAISILFIGFFLSGHAYIEYSKVEEYRKNAKHTDAIVVKVVPVNYKNGTQLHFAIIGFMDEKGEKYVIKSGETGSKKKYHIGDKVKVYYMPENPKNAKLDNSDLYGAVSTLAILATVFLTLSTLVLFFGSGRVIVIKSF